jgi:alkylation response protein AidB-like acyl-CoA dehydrogenase
MDEETDMSTNSSSPDDFKILVEAARAYAGRTGRAVFDGTHADGVPERIAFALDNAFEIGIAASPDPAQPGYDFGIWGCAAHENGLEPSAEMLKAIAEVCGGLAMNLHVQGLASHCIKLSGAGTASTVRRVACAMQEESGMPGFASLKDPLLYAPAQIQTVAAANASGYSITGEKSFVYALPGTESFVVFCRVSGTWGCFLVPASAQGLVCSPAGPRTGLRACNLSHLTFMDVGSVQRIDDGNARMLLEHSLGLNWLGIAAIGTGIATGSVHAALRYASERYQGGTMIMNLPAVHMLIAEAMTNMETASTLVRVGVERFGGPGMLYSCAVTRLAALSLSAAAVTDAMQVFGGYGYMEDYGMEKRLRDVTVLKSVAGTLQYLKRFIFESAGDG